MREKRGRINELEKDKVKVKVSGVIGKKREKSKGKHEIASKRKL